MKRDLYLLALLPFAIFADAVRTAAERLDTYLADALNGADDE
jgi:hypothetical protein